MRLLDIKGFKHLDHSILVKSSLAKTLNVETILAISKNKIAFETSVNVAMGMTTQPYKKAEYETAMGLSYHIINPEKTKAYKIYHYDKVNSISVEWENIYRNNKLMMIGHSKFIRDMPRIFEGFSTWKLSAEHLRNLDYIMFDSHIGMCELESLYLREVFGELGT